MVPETYRISDFRFSTRNLEGRIKVEEYQHSFCIMRGYSYKLQTSSGSHQNKDLFFCGARFKTYYHILKLIQYINLLFVLIWLELMKLCNDSIPSYNSRTRLVRLCDFLNFTHYSASFNYCLFYPRKLNRRFRVYIVHFTHNFFSFQYIQWIHTKRIRLLTI